MSPVAKMDLFGSGPKKDEKAQGQAPMTEEDLQHLIKVMEKMAPVDTVSGTLQSPFMKILCKDLVMGWTLFFGPGTLDVLPSHVKISDDLRAKRRAVERECYEVLQQTVDRTGATLSISTAIPDDLEIWFREHGFIFEDISRVLYKGKSTAT